VLYECLTRSPPYRADSASVLVTSHLRDAIPQPSTARSGVPKALDGVIARGMAKKPEDRYASAGDLALAATEALSDPDQDHAANILRRSQQATLPASSPPPPTLAATEIAPPQPPAPRVSTPPPSPYPYPASSGPISGPVPQSSQGGPPSWAPSSGPVPTPSHSVPTPQYYQGNRGNWGGTPPGGPPPQQFAGATPWNQPPTPRKRNPWPIVAGIAALVVVIVLAAVGISIAVSNDDDSKHQAETSTTTTSTTSTTTTTTSSSPSNELQSKLLGLLPGGYPTGTCTPTTPKPNTIWVNVLAMVDCGQNTNQGGPSHAVYGLFANPDVLKKAFDDDIADVQLTNCPGGGPSPDGWHFDQTPTVTAGMIACGTYKNHPNVIWSNQSKLMLSDVFGDPPAMDDLHTWWGKFG
jgi:hypothetical protein